MARTAKSSASKSSTASKSKSSSSKKSEVSGDQLMSFYKDMLMIRRFEEKAGQLYGMGLIGGFCHLYIGQEAVVVGMTQAGKAGTRDHRAIAITATCWRAAWTPRRDGGADRSSRRIFARQGRLHAHVSREKNFFGGHGIVGAQVPLGTGLAFAHKYKDDGGVCHTYSATARQPGPGLRELQHGRTLEACRSSMSSKTTSMRWAPRLSVRSSNVELAQRGAAHGIPGRTGQRHGRDRSCRKRRQGA